MIVCKTIYEFIDYYVNGNKYFLELTFEDDKLYKELFDYCNDYSDAMKLVLLGELYENGICVEQDESKAFSYYEQAAKLNSSYGMERLADCYADGLGCDQDYNLAFEWYEKAAELGKTSAMWSLGYCYGNGEGCIQDNNLAFEWYKKSAELGNEVAMRSLGYCYENGIGCIQDNNLAFEWYKKSAELGNEVAMKRLADCYENGIGCIQDNNLAFEWYKKSAELGNEVAMFEIGYYYEYGECCAQDNNLAFEWYKKSAELGNEWAMNKLGDCYENGIGCIQDNNLAFEWYKKSAELGNEWAMNKLGCFYVSGIGCIQDNNLAFEWSKKSAESGNKVAMYNLGNCYENGIGCTQDYKLAFYWKEKSAELGDASAMLSLGYFYQEGYGCTQDNNLAFEWYKKSAESGNKVAMYNLGYCYENGIGCTQDYKLAFYWNEKSAELGDASAMLNLGYFYQKGYGCTQDNNLAFEWYKKSAELGNKVAMNNLGDCYENGIGCIQDNNLAFEWYKKSAELGNKVAMYNLGDCYENGIGCTQDYKLAFYWNEKSAELGDASAMLNLGYFYLKGYGCTQDNELAFSWYKKSAELGNEWAMNKLGCFYESGIGCAQDYNLAFEWYKKSAELGNEVAMYNLGDCYENGIGCTQDNNLAFEWYKKSAELGNEVAMYNLGYCYENGIGCTQDYKLAFYWNEKSAELGYASAMLYLGYFYQEGYGCTQDNELAFSWYKKSAELGNKVAMYNLGDCYENGYGCDLDLNLSLYWYNKALENNFEQAREDVERITKLIEDNKLKESKLVFGSRKDTFISWNHLDKDIKDDICLNLEQSNLLTVWESDGNGVGDINENIENAIYSSNSYIVILTGNSINSKWVEKEVELIFKKVDKTREYENVIRPIIINRINKDNKILEFDVIEAINQMDNNSPFKRLLNYCASFEDFDTGLNYSKIVSFLYEAIGNSLKIEYKNSVIKRYTMFSSALNSVVTSRNNANSIIAATLEFESGYLNRDIYDEENNKINQSHLLTYNTPSLIYGEGGIGKSLYLKNFIRKEFKDNRYIFYLECKNLIDVVDNTDILSIIKQKGFDNYFSIDEAQFVSIKSFEELFKSNNKIVILIDALDEIESKLRIKLIEKLNLLYQKYKNVKLIFTTRNKTDAVTINNSFSLETKVYELRGLELLDIERLYDNLSSKYIVKEKNNLKDKENRVIEFNPDTSKQLFFNRISKISTEIKKNPLLISNLIFIYFATHKVPDTSFDIINEAVLILMNDLEEERNSTFEYMSYIANDNINKVLGYLALQRLYDNCNSAETIIREYLEENYENIDYSEIANEIYKYLRRRAIIVNDNISHEIFKNYFASSYLFNLIFKLAKNAIQKKFYKFADDGKDNLEMLCSDNFSNSNESWNNIAINLLYKLDFEIYNLDTKKNMDEKHLSYKVFNETLIKTLKEKGYNEEIIEVVIKLLKSYSFHYNEFIQNYIG